MLHLKKSKVRISGILRMLSYSPKVSFLFQKYPVISFAWQLKLTCLWAFRSNCVLTNLMINAENIYLAISFYSSCIDCTLSLPPSKSWQSGTGKHILYEDPCESWQMDNGLLSAALCHCWINSILHWRIEVIRLHFNFILCHPDRQRQWGIKTWNCWYS